MKIAYHNPWKNSSENQGFMSMAEAGRKVGVELIACFDENDIMACKPDFVLSVASSIAKITDYPTYLTVHEPKVYLLENPQRLRNLFSYDGYLTISDTLVRFVKDFCAGVGRNEEPGFCYLTPQTAEIGTNWEVPGMAEKLSVIYFGTNWNRRMPLLFRALDSMDILRIYGPEDSWKSEFYRSYCGPVPFDGHGPQRIYAEYGIGLALMDERWQREDIISNRIFEISSVGAVSICPDMPWTRKWFGDSVLYYDPDRPMREIAEQVKKHHEFCKLNLSTAKQMGEKARRIFETHFSAERMLLNTVAYHERKIIERSQRLTTLPTPPEISIVLRCGGRSLDYISRAVDSIRSQSYGKFSVILARYQDIDLSSITENISGSIIQFIDLLIPGGGRAQMLFEGLKLVKTPYFAVLDDDDFWLSDHFEELFRAGFRVRLDFDIAFSGLVDFDFAVPYTEMLSSRRNISRFGFDGPIMDAIDIQNAISLSSFVARTDLLNGVNLEAPDIRTGEDSLLICILSWRSKPIFSFRPTAFYRRDAADGSNWQNDEQRRDDELSFTLRSGLSWAPNWLSTGTLAMVNRTFTSVRTMLGRSKMGEYVDRLTTLGAAYKVPKGILAPKGHARQICCGPYLKLPPGDYLVVLLVFPEPDEAIGKIPKVIAQADVSAPAEHRIFAQEELGIDDREVNLTFSIDETMRDWLIEFRIFTSGQCAFTVSSVGLHINHDGGKPNNYLEVSSFRPALVSPENLGAAELNAQISALHASTSWRITAPLRWIVEIIRGQKSERKR